MRKEKTTHGIICQNDKLGFVYRIARIEYNYNSDDQFEYVITPNYSVISLLSSDIFQGIPGLNLSKRKAQYIRTQQTPTFVSERTPGPNRVDLWELLDEANMSYLNRLEWLIRKNPDYSGDNLYVLAYTPADEKQLLQYDSLEELANRSVKVIEQILTQLCLGNDIAIGDVTINDSNRSDFYSVLMGLFKLEKTYLKKRIIEGLDKASKNTAQLGRPRKKISIPRFEELAAKFQAGQISAKEAAMELGISRSTFFRRMGKNKYQV